MNLSCLFRASRRPLLRCLPAISLILGLLALGGCVLKDTIDPLVITSSSADSLFAKNRAALLLMEGYNQMVINDEAGSQTFTQILSGQDGNRIRLFAGAPAGPFLVLESPPWDHSQNSWLSLFTPGEIPVTGWSVLYRPDTVTEDTDGEKPFSEPAELHVIKRESLDDGIKLWLRCIDPQQSNDTLRLLMPIRIFTAPTPQ